MTLERIAVPKPPIGAKCWVLDRKGDFLLEEQPGNLFHITCTHAGAGSLEAFDLDDRPLLLLRPTAMGVWHLNGGFHHGLKLRCTTGTHDIPPIASVVWHSKAEKRSDLVLAARKSAQLELGRRQLCGKDCILYEVLITVPGAGEIDLFDGLGRRVYAIPSMFRGSFMLEHVFCFGGLFAQAHWTVPITMSVVWLEEG